MSRQWRSRLCRLRHKTLSWLEKEKRPQAFLASRLGCDRSRISTFLSGTWDPCEKRSLEFVEALEQIVYGDERDCRWLPNVQRHDRFPGGLSPEEEEGWLAGQCVEHELERRNQLLDNFSGPTALLLADGLYFKALDAGRCAGRLSFQMVGFYMSAFMRVYEDRLWHEVSDAVIARHLRWLGTMEERAHEYLPGESDAPCLSDRLSNFGGMARVAAGLILIRRRAPRSRYQPLVDEGCEKLLRSLQLDLSQPRDVRMGVFESERGPQTAKIVLAANAFYAFDLLLGSGDDSAPPRAVALADQLQDWDSQDVRDVFERVNATTLSECWKHSAPELVESLQEVREDR